MKTKIQKIVAVIILVTILGLIWSMTTKSKTTEVSLNLEVGKTYQKTTVIDGKDPFTPVRIDTFIVIDKKSDYVKWSKLGWIKGDSVTLWISSPEYFLSRGCKLIK